MRLALVGSAVVLCLVAAGCCARVSAGPPPHRPHLRPAPVRFEEAPRDQAWTATGWGKTADDAAKMALEKSRKELGDFLARQDPPVRWQPPAEFVNLHLVKERKTELKDLPDLGPMYEATFEVKLEPKDYRQILENDRQDRAGERQLLLAKVVGALLAVLLAVFGYFRLEETTRGYYTWWLRLGAVALVGAAGLLLLIAA